MQTIDNIRFKPANRKWTAIGMVLGAAIGFTALSLPQPWYSLVAWVTIFCAAGLILGIFLAGYFLSRITNGVLISICCLAVVGSLTIGLAIWSNSSELPEGNEAGPISCGLLLGYFIVEFLLKRLDAKNKIIHENVYGPLSKLLFETPFPIKVTQCEMVKTPVSAKIEYKFADESFSIRVMEPTPIFSTHQLLHCCQIKITEIQSLNQFEESKQFLELKDESGLVTQFMIEGFEIPEGAEWEAI